MKPQGHPPTDLTLKALGRLRAVRSDPVGSTDEVLGERKERNDDDNDNDYGPADSAASCLADAARKRPLDDGPCRRLSKPVLSEGSAEDLNVASGAGRHLTWQGRPLSSRQRAS
eukprot:6281752-Pyramimonas_sp.AAC.1